MKKVKIAYWISTALFAFMMLGSAIPDVLSSPVAVKGMHEGLGYPVFFIPFIGVAKVLGVIAILVPRFSKLKEWAYAGLFFDLIGATYSIIAVGAPVGNWIGMALPVALGICSYVFYHKKLKAALRSASSYANYPSNYFNGEKVEVSF